MSARRRLVVAVAVTALGFLARLKPEDLVILRNFVDTLSQGVVIR